MENNKTHYRRAFNSPYLSSADIVDATVLTISRVELEPDKTKKTKDHFNTAYFTDKELRPGEPLKPMILNAGNSRTMAAMTGSKFIDDWTDVPVTIYVDQNVRFGRDTVEGLRISAERPVMSSPCSTEQIEEIETELLETESDIEKFCKVVGIKMLANLDTKSYANAKELLKTKRAQLERAKNDNS